MTDERSTLPILDTVREAIRVRHYSIRTEDAQVHWIKRHILFHGKRHPKEMGETEVAGFLSNLATQRTLAAGAGHRLAEGTTGVGSVALEWALVLSARTGSTGRCCRRRALATTRRALADIMPRAAAQGGIRPAAASGTAVRL